MCCGRYTLTTSSLKFATARSTGSLTAAAPAIIAMADRPPKITRCSVPDLTSAASPASPTLVPPISSGRSPVSFDRRSRTREPPALTRTRWRIVPWTGAGALMMSSGTKWTGAAGLAPQVPIHSCISGARRVGPPRKLAPPLEADRESRHDGSRFVGKAHLCHERRNVETEERVIIVLQIISDHFDPPPPIFAAHAYPRAEIVVRGDRAKRIVHG